MSPLRFASMALGCSAVPAMYLGHSPWASVVLALAFLCADVVREYTEARRALADQLKPLYAAVEKAESRAKWAEEALEKQQPRLHALEQAQAAANSRITAFETRVFGGAFGGPQR